MTFKVQPIKSHKKSGPPEMIKWIVKIVIILIAVFVVGGFAYAAYRAVTQHDFTLPGITEIIGSIAGKQLKTDRLGKTNILLLGVGGGEHSGGLLTDSIMVASYDHQKKTVVMVSIPRDLFVKTGSGSLMRINQAYSAFSARKKSKQEAVADTEALMTRITGLDIQYYAKIDFQAFVQVVDILGGIDVEVPKAIVDPDYPVETQDGIFIRNETFRVNAGMQHMDGQTALKYVRSRHSTSDFDRSQRQQIVLVALKDKAQSLNYLTSPSKMTRLYNALVQNMETDVSLQEMITGADIATNIDRSRVVSVGLTDDTTKPGGTLYPPDRALTGGASVLLPIGATVYNPDNFTLIQRVVDIAVNSPEIYLEKIPVMVRNGTKKTGLAARVKEYLIRYGFTVIDPPPAEKGATPTGKPVPNNTKIYSVPDYLNSKTLEVLPVFIPGEVVSRPVDPTGKIGNYIEIVLGDDFNDKFVLKSIAGKS